MSLKGQGENVEDVTLYTYNVYFSRLLMFVITLSCWRRIIRIQVQYSKIYYFNIPWFYSLKIVLTVQRFTREDHLRRRGSREIPPTVMRSFAHDRRCKEQGRRSCLRCVAEPSDVSWGREYRTVIRAWSFIFYFFQSPREMKFHLKKSNF